MHASKTEGHWGEWSGERFHVFGSKKRIVLNFKGTKVIETAKVTYAFIMLLALIGSNQGCGDFNASFIRGNRKGSISSSVTEIFTILFEETSSSSLSSSTTKAPSSTATKHRSSRLWSIIQTNRGWGKGFLPAVLFFFLHIMSMWV